MIPIYDEGKLTIAKYTKLFKDVFTDENVASFFGNCNDFNSEILAFTNLSIPGGVYNLSELLKSKYRYYEICDSDTEVFATAMDDVLTQWYDYYYQLAQTYYKNYDIAVDNVKKTMRADKSLSNNKDIQTSKKTASVSGNTNGNDTETHSENSANRQIITDKTHSEETQDNATGNQHREYELPNAVVPGNTENGYLTKKTTDQGNETKDIATDSDSTGTNTTEGNTNVEASRSSDNAYEESSEGQVVNTGTNEKTNNYDSDIETHYNNLFLDLKKQYLNQVRNLMDEFANRFSDCFLHIF